MYLLWTIFSCLDCLVHKKRISALQPINWNFIVCRIDFSHSIVLDTIHRYKCWFVFSIFFFPLPIPFIFFCSTIVAAAVSVAILLRYSLLNFVSFVNSNKLSIVLNMCYSWSQYTMHKTLEQFLKIFKYLRDENTIQTQRGREKRKEVEWSTMNASSQFLTTATAALLDSL